MEVDQKIKPVNIDSEMRESYLSYAMSVIVARALPDARDGLKPVQRRILYAMHDMRLNPGGPYKKSARVVGETLGKYHPHADQSVYDAMVRLAQDFSMRYPLVDGQGNFGSIDGDAAAAMRYTEVRLTEMGQDLLSDIDKETVDFVPNFDDSLTEPEVLPAVLPNLLINGSSGIAVGMATSVPPHNLGEVVDALSYMLDHWQKLDDVTVADLMAFVKGPDFPTGGLVYRYRENGEADALLNAYSTGRGRVVVRAKAHVEQMERNKSRLVITELPYQTNKTNLISRIADLHRDGKIDGLTDLRDESDRNGMRIIIETTRNVEPEAVLAELFRQTPMQSTFSIIMVALVNGEPRVLTLKQALRYYLDHRLEITRRRSEYDLRRARERAHVLAGLLIALDNLDAVIALIRRSRTVDTARTNLQKQFKLTEIQAQAILDMQLRRLAGLERKKIQEEYEEKLRVIKYLEELLSKPELMRNAVRKELVQVKEKYADIRRSQIVEGSESKTITANDLLPDQKVWVLIGEKGKVARTSSPDMIAIPRKPDELPLTVLEANTQDILYLFTADGLAVSLPVYQLPQAQAMGQGTHWAELTGLTRRHHVAAALIRPTHLHEGYLFLTSLGGVVKRVRLEDLPGITSAPFTVINVADTDALGWARLTRGQDEVILFTAAGQVIRFQEETVRPMGLPAGGVLGIKLADEADGIVGMELAQAGSYAWSITDNGLAKATLLEQYPVQGRYGQGVVNLKLPTGASEVVAGLVGLADSYLLVKLSIGAAHRFKLEDTIIGSRAIKPRPLVKVNAPVRVTGAVALRMRPVASEAETTPPTPKQMSLLGD
jgi:DNA gyrase subunit A